MPSENQSFLDEGVMTHQNGMGVLGGQMTRLYDGTIFGGGATHLGGHRGPSKMKVVFFSNFRHTRDSPISSRFRP